MTVSGYLLLLFIDGSDVEYQGLGNLGPLWWGTCVCVCVSVWSYL